MILRSNMSLLLQNLNRLSVNDEPFFGFRLIIHNSKNLNISYTTIFYYYRVYKCASEHSTINNENFHIAIEVACNRAYNSTVSVKC